MKKHVWILVGLAMMIGSCRNFWGRRIRGNGNIKTEERSVSSFKSVEASGAIKVYVSQGSASPVKIEGDENLLPYVEVAQEEDLIIIRQREGINLDPTGDIRVYLTSPEYKSIEVSGASDIIGQNKISNTENLELHTSGVGNIKMEVDAPKISADISGVGSIDLTGQTKDLDLDLSGAGHAHCFDLMAENTKVTMSGVGSAEVYCSVRLDAEVSGAGSVRYKGSATNINQNISGVGSVKKAD